MVKKGMLIFILVTMALHFASQTGMLSYLYQQRHTIAYRIGFLMEIPVAMCSSDYDFGRGLLIQAQDETDQSMPPASFQPKEMQLFFCAPKVEVNPELALICMNRVPAFVETFYTAPALSIFHPPS